MLRGGNLGTIVRERGGRMQLTQGSLVSRLGGGAPARGALTRWIGIAFAAMLVLPCRAYLGVQFWALPLAAKTQVWVWGAAFLAFALFLSLYATRAEGVSARSVAGAGAVCWGAAFAVLHLLPDIAFSRGNAAAAISLGSLFGLAPYLLPQRLPAATVALALSTLAAALAGTRTTDLRQVIREPVTTRSLPTAVHTVTLTRFAELVESSITAGGGIKARGDGFVLVDGVGAFHELRWVEGGEALQATRMALRVPIGREEYPESLGTTYLRGLRATGLLLDTVATPARAIVAYQHWNAQGQCVSARVAAVPLPAVGAAAAPSAEWRVVFESANCRPLTDELDVAETGGALAWYRDGSVLLTLGDRGVTGRAGNLAVAQDMRASGGKIHLLDLKGGSRIFSLGHRNPQGVLVDREGRIWSSEHGPQGGDELNVIERGRNYGWPVVTYGTQYGQEVWPFGDGGRDHGAYAEPAFAFVPSIAPTGLLQVGGREFPRWEDDLLVASLRAESIFRVRTRAGAVRYVEQIPVGHRVRDLAEGKDGRIVLWTGNADLLVLSLGEPSAGALAYRACAQCHGDALTGTAAGPSLRSVLTRAVAGRADFEYSSALKSLGGRWDERRMDAFLRDPAAFAPGTSMSFPGLADADARRALIEYLRSNN